MNSLLNHLNLVSQQRVSLNILTTDRGAAVSFTGRKLSVVRLGVEELVQTEVGPLECCRHVVRLTASRIFASTLFDCYLVSYVVSQSREAVFGTL